MNAYQRLESREIYRNPYVWAEVHTIVHPSGVRGEHLLVAAPQCSAVVVADGDDLLFTRQPRFAAEIEAVEIVKGGVEGSETPLECAQRELREELGLEAAHWQPLGTLWEIPSIVTPAVEIFYAHGVEHVESVPDAVESIELVRVPRAAAFQAAASGVLGDALTLAALLRYGLSTGVLTAG